MYSFPFWTSPFFHVWFFCFLTCIQVSQETSKVVWCSHLFKNFPQFVVIHTVKGFSVVSEAEVDIFPEFPSFLYDPINLVNLIPGSSAFSKSSLYIWKFSVHILLKPSLKDFEHYLASMWNEFSCVVVWTFFGIALLWDWNENCPFQSYGHCWVFPVCWHIECSTLAFQINNVWLRRSSSGLTSHSKVSGSW